MKILVINPGGMSTKIAVYENKTPLFSETIEHSTDDLAAYPSIIEQKKFRKKLIIDLLDQKGIALRDIDEFVGRGGMVRNLAGGIYEVNESYLHDAATGFNGQHASNLGGILANELAKEISQIKIAYTVDPVVVDEYADIARISGMADISRVRSFHALNHKAVAHRFAREGGFITDKLNLIVAHLGSGISIGAHKNGRVIDVNSALGGDGPMSPERAGGVPPLALIDMCYSGQYTYQQMYKKLIGEGGVFSYLQTKDMREVEQRVQNGDRKAALILEALSYQVSKEIGACATVLYGKVDAIILTGSIAKSSMITNWIKERVGFLCHNIVIYPGEGEMEALVQGVLDAKAGRRPILTY